ncbi:MAG: Rgg/GadR/MutR family transcriptional regulator, partial [Streptococcaceae bacterium]|nr:Rgg/GadR/MutR family transcriptional regulator [Streptococcaceae bacterium]
MDEEEKIPVGEAFKKLRELSGVKKVELHEILGKSALDRLELGTSEPSFEKMEQALDYMGFTVSDFSYFRHTGVVKTYGRLFHDLRFQQGYREDFFEQLGVNEVRLRLFEEGRIMLPFSTLDEMLLEMHVPERDYSFWLNGGQLDWFISSIHQLELAHYKGDLETIQEIETRAHEFANQQEINSALLDGLKDHHYVQERVTKQYTDYRILELTAKKYRINLTAEEEAETSDFLFGIEIWTEFDLGILALNAGRLETPALKLILDEIYQNFSAYKGSRIYREHLVQVSGRAASRCIKDGKLEEAADFIAYSKPILYDISARVHGLSRFIEAQLAFAKGDEHGNFEMLKVI